MLEEPKVTFGGKISRFKLIELHIHTEKMSYWNNIQISTLVVSTRGVAKIFNENRNRTVSSIQCTHGCAQKRVFSIVSILNKLNVVNWITFMIVTKAFRIKQQCYFPNWLNHYYSGFRIKRSWQITMSSWKTSRKLRLTSNHAGFVQLYSLKWSWSSSHATVH